MTKSTRQRNYRILFIDDSHPEINYLKLLFQITDLPAIPIFINSAPEGLDILDNYKSSDFPDVILVDINMPFMNGFEFAESYIKKGYALRFPKTKLFIYSTSIHSVDIQRANSIEGVTGFIAKPFDENTFYNKILPHLHPSIELVSK